MDSTKLSLANYMDIPELDIMQRSQAFSEFLADVKARHHLQYKRVSIDGSGPVRQVIDQYSGEIKKHSQLNYCKCFLFSGGLPETRTPNLLIKRVEPLSFQLPQLS